jgi:hypothetical protein
VKPTLPGSGHVLWGKHEDTSNHDGHKPEKPIPPPPPEPKKGA